MTRFTPDFSKIETGEPSELARRRLIEYVRQYAAHKSVSQADLSNLTGIHSPNISRLFSGRYSLGLDTFLKIAGALDLSVEITKK